MKSPGLAAAQRATYAADRRWLDHRRGCRTCLRELQGLIIKRCVIGDRLRDAVLKATSREEVLGELFGTPETDED